MPDSYEPNPGEEEKLTNEIIRILKTSLEKDYTNKKVLRRFHAKTLGLVSGKLIVDENLPGHLKVGLFAKAGQYPALIRFSNANPKINDDSKAGMRGMAVKVFLQGKPNDSEINNVKTQDFITTSSDILFPGTPRDMFDAIRLIFAMDLRGLRLSINHPVKFFNFFIQPRKTGSVLEISYFSGTPYSFGEEPVKWKFRPMQPAISPLPRKKGDHYFLTRQLAAAVISGQYGFDILVQFQKDKKREPIEDSSVRWETSFEKVGVLMFDKEDITTPERKSLGEMIRFNPWNCIPEHIPLGGINRIRQRIYDELGKLRG